MNILTADTLERWNNYLQQQCEDREFVERNQARDEIRKITRVQILELLEQFQKGQISVKEFQTTFDRKTRVEWNQFGLKGMSGAMFLNMLVKHIPEEADLTGSLKAFLRQPESEGAALQTMQSFQTYLDQLIRSGKVKKVEVQPARIPYFLSIFWHMQEVETWPIYYGSAIDALRRDGIFDPEKTPNERYFVFRSIFLQLAKALKLSIWDFEHLCFWLAERKDGPTTPPAPEPPTPRPTPVVGEKPGAETTGTSPSVHAHVQWALAKLGQKFNLKVWIAQNDRSKVWEGETLDSLSIKNMPMLGLDEQSQKIIQLIDVVWLRGNNQIAAAFEVEYTTSIYSGLLRMSDLAALAPNLMFPLYIIAPEERIPMVQRELLRPTFQAIGLHERCGFFSIEEFFHEYGNIKRWARDPDAINNLAQKVESVNY